MISVNNVDLSPDLPKCQRLVAEPPALTIYCFANEVPHIIDVYMGHKLSFRSRNTMFVGP